jgi:electron transport complex protein RnfE
MNAHAGNNSLLKDLVRGIWRENPIFRLVLGLCPTLAVSTSLENGLGMGAAATFVLVCSNTAISAMRRAVPPRIRIPCFIIVIATFVTTVDLLMNAFAHQLHGKLGIFIPLIVVNCIILGRAEAFASRRPILHSAADGLGMGIGFTGALALLGASRELIGSGTVTLWGEIAWRMPGGEDHALILAILPAGGFIGLAFLLALMNHIQSAVARRTGTTFVPPEHLDCHHCIVSSLHDPSIR